MPISIHPTAVALAVLTLFGASVAGAQSSTLAPGTRVRVTSSQVVAPVIGSYQGMRRDTVLVIEDGESAQQWAFTTAEIRRLEVSAGMGRGNRGPIVRNALLGAGLGAAAGVILAFILEESTDSEYNTVLSGLVGAGVGSGLGAMYGFRVQQEHWTAVAVPRRIGLIPGRVLRVGFRASF